MAVSCHLSSVKRALAEETNWNCLNDGGRRGKLRFNREKDEVRKAVPGQGRRWEIERPPGGGLSEFVLRRMSAGQAGHSDRPVQEPRVKLAPSFVTPAATSSVSSEMSKQSVSSWAFSAISVMTRILLVGACSNQISDDRTLFVVFTPR